MSVTVQCPNCKKTVSWNSDHPFKPFCSEKCKLIDLGDWAEERHTIPGKPELPDEFDIDEPSFFLDNNDAEQ